MCYDGWRGEWPGSYEKSECFIRDVVWTARKVWKKKTGDIGEQSGCTCSAATRLPNGSNVYPFSVCAHRSPISNCCDAGARWNQGCHAMAVRTPAACEGASPAGPRRFCCLAHHRVSSSTFDLRPSPSPSPAPAPEPATLHFRVGLLGLLASAPDRLTAISRCVAAVHWTGRSHRELAALVAGPPQRQPDGQCSEGGYGIGLSACRAATSGICGDSAWRGGLAVKHRAALRQCRPSEA